MGVHNGLAIVHSITGHKGLESWPILSNENKCTGSLKKRNTLQYTSYSSVILYEDCRTGLCRMAALTTQVCHYVTVYLSVCLAVFTFYYSIKIMHITLWCVIYSSLIRAQMRSGLLFPKCSCWSNISFSFRSCWKWKKNKDIFSDPRSAHLLWEEFDEHSSRLD